MGIQKKILIVDDKGINRFMLAQIFGDDYQVIEASGGRQAIEIIKEHKNQLAVVLLDIIMPDIDGFGVLEYLKEHDMLKEVPIVIVTDDSSAQTGMKAYEYGVADIVIKPFEPKIIQRRVNNIIELYAYREKYGAL